jgi:hypothetical protein
MFPGFVFRLKNINVAETSENFNPSLNIPPFVQPLEHWAEFLFNVILVSQILFRLFPNS